MTTRDTIPPGARHLPDAVDADIAAVANRRRAPLDLDRLTQADRATLVASALVASYHQQPRETSRQQTARTLSEAIGRHARIRHHGIRPTVRITDARYSWGKVQYLIVPVAGDGSQWVDASTLDLTPDRCTNTLIAAEVTR